MAKTKEKVVRRCAWTGCKEDISHRGNRAMFCEEHQKENRRNQDRSRRVPAKGKRQVNGDASQWAAASESTRMDSVAQMRMLPVKALEPSQSRAQALRRGRFDEAAIEELAASVRSVGIVEPLVVRADESIADRWQIVAGERRWLAAQRAGLAEVPCVVREFDDEQATVVQLIENLQRLDMDPLSEAEGFGVLVRSHGWDAERVAKEIGRSRSHVYGRLQLLDLAPGCRAALAEGEINATVGRTLCSVPASLQDAALNALRKEQDGYDGPLTTREIEDVIDWEFRRRIDGSAQEIGFDPAAKLVAIAFGGDMPLVDAPQRACTACKWNTSHNRSLGGSKGMCAHPDCHAYKQEQHADASAKAFEGEVVLATANSEFTSPTSTEPSRRKYVVDSWEIKGLRQQIKRAVPDVLFVCKDRARAGPRTFVVLRRKEAEAALPKRAAKAPKENEWQRKSREAKARIERVAARVRPLFESEPTPEQAAALQRFVVQEFRQRAWSTTINAVGKRWKGADDRDVPLETVCPDDAKLRRFMLDLALAQAADSEHSESAEAFAAACGL